MGRMAGKLNNQPNRMIKNGGEDANLHRGLHRAIFDTKSN